MQNFGLLGAQGLLEVFVHPSEGAGAAPGAARSCHQLAAIGAILTGPFAPFGASPIFPVPTPPFSLPSLLPPLSHLSQMPLPPLSSSPSPSLSQCPRWGRALAPAVPRRRKLWIFPPSQAPAVGQEPRLGSCSRRVPLQGRPGVTAWADSRCLGCCFFFNTQTPIFYVLNVFPSSSLEHDQPPRAQRLFMLLSNLCCLALAWALLFFNFILFPPLPLATS